MPSVGRTYNKNELHTQSVRFKKSAWSKAEAKKFCEDNNYYIDGLDETINEYRFRQYDPSYSRFNYFKENGKKAGMYFIKGTPKT